MSRSLDIVGVHATTQNLACPESYRASHRYRLQNDVAARPDHLTRNLVLLLGHRLTAAGIGMSPYAARAAFLVFPPVMMAEDISGGKSCRQTVGTTVCGKMT